MRYGLAWWGGPRPLVAAWLSLRWRCWVSPRARIRWIFRLTIGRGTWIGDCVIIASGAGIKLGSKCEIFDGAYLHSQEGFIDIGSHSGIGPYSLVYGEGGLTIGDYCAIAGHTTIIPASHNFGALDAPIRLQGSSSRGIVIESDCWIGANCVVLDGAHIENGCVIGASSVVRGRIPALSIAMGVPAIVKKSRAGRNIQP